MPSINKPCQLELSYMTTWLPQFISLMTSRSFKRGTSLPGIFGSHTGTLRRGGGGRGVHILTSGNGYYGNLHCILRGLWVAEKPWAQGDLRSWRGKWVTRDFPNNPPQTKSVREFVQWMKAMRPTHMSWSWNPLWQISLNYSGRG